jgi:DNA repair protein SbcC/Rad50
MRPLTLEIEGFTAFRNRTCIDFSRLDLFAITGPTGAGKSSLIDAISYALYGRVPRVNNEVNACISQGLERMQVSLVFRAGDADYRVFREAKRKGAGAVRLEKLGMSEWQPLADKSADVREKVERIVGLDFDGFTRSVLLPQGQFQEFLAGAPDKRRDVLRRLLRLELYERMRQAASAESLSKKSRIEAIDRILREELSEATPEALAQRTSQLEQAEQDSERLDTEIRALEAGIGLAIELASRRRALAEAEKEEQDARTLLAAAEKTASQGSEELERIEAAYRDVNAALSANAYDDQLFANLTAAANAALELQRTERQRNEAGDRLKLARQRAERASAAVAGAAAAHQQAAATLEEAEAAHEEALRHDLAAALQAGLRAGDPCPVCGGKVGEIEPAAAGRVEGARARLEQARKREGDASGAAEAARREEAVSAAAVAGLEEALTAVEGQAAEQAKRLAEALPDMKDRSLAAVQAALQEQKQHRDERNRLVQEERQLGEKLRRLESEVARARSEHDALQARAEAATRAAEDSSESVTNAMKAALEAADASGWQPAAAALRAGGDPLPLLRDALAAVKAEHQRVLIEEGRLREQLKQIERDIERARGLRSEMAVLKGENDVAADLAQMLQANRFQAYLQAEALESLADAGSRRLLELSSGRYELGVAEGGQDFVVVDKWNVDEARSVRTLSGGETFLASLALSLALAESMPGLAPDRRVTLDSIFLDEGFGMLDPEALLLAREALDALSLGERFVCVVTHLPELAESLPARLVVRKLQTGSTVEVV